MIWILQLVLAVLPGLIIIWYIHREDIYEKERWIPLFLCFVLGMLITYPVIKVQELFYGLGWKETGGFWTTILSAFVLVALTEELVKYLALLVYPYRNKFLSEPLDGIVYAIYIGMGFATLENILYAYRYDISTTIVRAITAVPAHATFAAIMGYYIGKAKFDQQGKRYTFLFRGLFMAVLLHGLYDFFVLQEIDESLMILSMVILIVSILFTLELIRELQNQSPYKKDRT
ncbi:MAG: PrsW family intramembrane metalloprotease [Saprospiraceae bacterium]|nr:PrsW family intramembrane metalloprotease [Saprospiraceae bacterium]